MIVMQNGEICDPMKLNESGHHVRYIPEGAALQFGGDSAAVEWARSIASVLEARARRPDGCSEIKNTWGYKVAFTNKNTSPYGDRHAFSTTPEATHCPSCGVKLESYGGNWLYHPTGEDKKYIEWLLENFKESGGVVIENP
jgi:hypothetical protein